MEPGSLEMSRPRDRVFVVTIEPLGKDSGAEDLSDAPP